MKEAIAELSGAEVVEILKYFSLDTDGTRRDKNSRLRKKIKLYMGWPSRDSDVTSVTSAISINTDTENEMEELHSDAAAVITTTAMITIPTKPVNTNPITVSVETHVTTATITTSANTAIETNNGIVAGQTTTIRSIGTVSMAKFSNDKFITGIGSWYGHLGGIEGLRQKGWTLWTVALILLAAEDQPLSLKLMGQGDNQVLKEIYPDRLTDKEVMDIHFSFLKNLNEILLEIEPPLKVEETWTSRDLYIYGKNIIYKASPLPTSGKRVCRMIRLSNEDYPTLESTISSLTANLTSAISCHYTPSVFYYIYCSESVGAFQLFLNSAYLQSIPPREVLMKNSILIIPQFNQINCLSNCSKGYLEPLEDFLLQISFLY